MSKKLTDSGYDPSSVEDRARVLAKARGLLDNDNRKRGAGEMDVDEGDDDESEWGDQSMEVDGGDGSSRKRAKTSIVPRGKRTPVTNRQTAGLKDTEVLLHFLSSLLDVIDPLFCQQQATQAVKLRALAQRGPNRLAKASESDRHIRTKMPRHLFSGKRGAGKTNRR